MKQEFNYIASMIKTIIERLDEEAEEGVVIIHHFSSDNDKYGRCVYEVQKTSPKTIPEAASKAASKSPSKQAPKAVPKAEPKTVKI